VTKTKIRTALETARAARDAHTRGLGVDVLHHHLAELERQLDELAKPTPRRRLTPPEESP
jgi:hypothetical protein